MINLFLFPTKSLSCTIIFVIFLIPSCVLSIDERHLHCAKRFSCGNQRALSYPFWAPDRAECGHQDFQVNCSGEFAVLSISSVKFRILKMNYDDRIIKLARMDNNLCPKNPVNSTFDQDILPFSSDTRLLHFYYKCRDLEVDLPPNGNIKQLECEDNSSEKNYVVLSPLYVGNRSILDVLSASCKRSVDIPVSRSALGIAETNRSVADIKKAIDKGFELKFNSDCSRCVTSGGSCGYNQSSRAFVCYCIDKPHKNTCSAEIKRETRPPAKASLTREGKLGIGFASGFLVVILIAGSLYCFIIRRRNNLEAQYTSKDLPVTLHYPSHHDLKALLPLKHYSYPEVKKITKSFTHILGKGGFGTVYKGILFDGRKVAVKILKDSKSNGEDFINEVASISQTSHVNIVSLLGFCYEGSNRAIVYEFLENGSLDQFISSKKSLNIDMITLYGIALGVARGLEYLHYGCKTRIVHFDIKPQNVLLDNNLCPKVSDFGLAKLCEKRESVMSLIETRGTIGYIAPEVFSRMYGVISHKSDVYSYGMLILEMVGARNKEIEENAASNASSTYFPDWIYKNVENGEYKGILGDHISGEDKYIGQKMILVGLWCIQPRPSDRPPMNRVVDMLEGSLDTLEVPPKPLLQLPEAEASLFESSRPSKGSTMYSEV